MKISIEQANKLLQGLVNDVEVVASDPDKDVDLTAVEAELKDNLTAQIKPDIEAELKETIKTGEIGKFMGTVRSGVARTFGMKTSDLADKDLADIFKLAKENYDKTSGKDAEAWQKEREELIRGHEDELANTIKKMDEIIASEKNKYIERDIMATVLGMTEKIPRKKGDLQEHADIALYKMRKEYEVKYNEETKSLELYKDGKPAMNGSKKLLPEEYVKTVFEKSGIIETDTRNIKPSDVKKGEAANHLNLEDAPNLDHVPENIRDLVAATQD